MSAIKVDDAAVLKWDIRNWSRALDLWAQALPADLPGHTALEIGAGDGGLSLFLADRGCNVTCSDYASTAATAQQHHKRYGLDNQIRYTRADATKLPFADSTFDIAAFKSVLGGIGRHHGLDGQRRTIHELHRVLKPGGTLLFADNLRGTWLHRFIRRAFIPWGHDWRYLSLAEFQSLFEPFQRVEITSFGVIAALGRTESQRATLHHLDRLLSPLTPPAARYIGYGYAIR